MGRGGFTGWGCCGSGLRVYDLWVAAEGSGFAVLDICKGPFWCFGAEYVRCRAPCSLREGFEPVGHSRDKHKDPHEHTCMHACMHTYIHAHMHACIYAYLEMYTMIRTVEAPQSYSIGLQAETT